MPDYVDVTVFATAALTFFLKLTARTRLSNTSAIPIFGLSADLPLTTEARPFVMVAIDPTSAPELSVSSDARWKQF